MNMSEAKHLENPDRCPRLAEDWFACVVVIGQDREFHYVGAGAPIAKITCHGDDTGQHYSALVRADGKWWRYRWGVKPVLTHGKVPTLAESERKLDRLITETLRKLDEERF